MSREAQLSWKILHFKSASFISSLEHANCDGVLGCTASSRVRAATAASFSRGRLEALIGAAMQTQLSTRNSCERHRSLDLPRHSAIRQHSRRGQRCSRTGVRAQPGTSRRRSVSPLRLPVVSSDIDDDLLESQEFMTGIYDAEGVDHRYVLYHRPMGTSAMHHRGTSPVSGLVQPGSSRPVERALTAFSSLLLATSQFGHVGRFGAASWCFQHRQPRCSVCERQPVTGALWHAHSQPQR